MSKTFLAYWPIIALVLVASTLAFNQYQISSILSPASPQTSSEAAATESSTSTASAAPKDLSSLDLNSIKSTAGAIAAVFPLNDVKNADDIVGIMFPTGTPAYGKDMGVSFDDPIGSLALMANAYQSLKAEAQKDPALWQRYLNLATKPVGISCEFCCGVGPVGITPDGELRCGCQHSPAVQSVTLWLMMNTKYSDAEILREVMKWKTLFFPKNMVDLGVQVAGKDASQLSDLPGMVGGC